MSSLTTKSRFRQVVTFKVTSVLDPLLYNTQRYRPKLWPVSTFCTGSLSSPKTQTHQLPFGIFLARTPPKQSNKSQPYKPSEVPHSANTPQLPLPVATG